MTNRERVLIVGDAGRMSQLYQTFIARAGLNAEVLPTGVDLLTHLTRSPARVAIVDLDGKPGKGAGAMRQLTGAHPEIRIIALSSNGSVRIAVDAIREGAFDFLVNPFGATRLAEAVQKAVSTETPADAFAENRSTEQEFHYCGFVGKSPAMRSVYRTIDAAAASDVTVFITGESGTGKEVAAEAIHSLSLRRDKPFVALNCGAISRELAESELFGHCKGSFTGAIADRAGAVRQADGGTLFLDELCEMPSDLQIKLLRFLQSGTFRPVGAAVTEHVDVRIVCATNRDPLEEVASGRFREDLYYRLHVIPLRMPALRERGEDMLLVAEYLLRRYVGEYGGGDMEFAPCATEKIMAYPWPGNIRQLQNVIRHAVVMHPGAPLTAFMLPLPELPGSQEANINRMLASSAPPVIAKFETPNNSADVPQRTGIDPADWRTASDIVRVSEMEKVAIDRAIVLCDGNVVQAAMLLGLNPSTIYRKKRVWQAA